MCCHTHVRLTVQQVPQLTVAHSAEGPFRQSEPGAALVGKHLLTSEAAEISPLFHSPFFSFLLNKFLKICCVYASAGMWNLYGVQDNFEN